MKLMSFHNDLDTPGNAIACIAKVAEIANLKGINGHRVHSISMCMGIENGNPEWPVYDIYGVVEGNPDLEDRPNEVQIEMTPACFNNIVEDEIRYVEMNRGINESLMGRAENE